MNRALRRTHFLLVAGLTPVAVGIFALSIAARKNLPASPIPVALNPAPVPMQETGRRLMRAKGFDVEVRGLVNSDGIRFLELRPVTEPHVADLLAYVGPGNLDGFNQEARLLGPVSGTLPVRYLLPADSTRTLTELFLYSLASRTFVGRVNLVDSTESGR